MLYVRDPKHILSFYFLNKLLKRNSLLLKLTEFVNRVINLIASYFYFFSISFLLAKNFYTTAAKRISASLREYIFINRNCCVEIARVCAAGDS